MELVPSLWAAAAPTSSFNLLQFLPLVLVFGLMYVFWIRPQQQKDAKNKEMLAALKVGDTVMTQAGLIGTLVALTDEREILVRLCPEVDVRMVRGAISQVITSDVPKKVRQAFQRDKGRAKDRGGAKPARGGQRTAG